MREFIRDKRKKDPNYKLTPKNTTMGGGPGGPPAPEEEEKEVPPGVESVVGMEVGMRCEAAPGARRGTIRFIGEIEEITIGGVWVGVQLDEPSGSNDGTVKGARKFECTDKYGAFVRGPNLVVGDFPEKDPFASDDEEENKAPVKEDDDEF
jgi:tubulin-folding cofactor B